MKTIILAGSGKNGKTTCVQEMQKMIEGMGKTHHTFLSTTRDTFARLGFSTEKAGLDLTPEQQSVLQEEVFSDYLAGLVREANEADYRQVDYFLADRSPFDYAGYVIQSQPWRTQEQLDSRYLLSVGAIGDVSLLGYVYLVLLPAQPTWHASIQDDGYRHAPAAKNYAWSACVETLVRQASQYGNFRDIIGNYRIDNAPSSEARAEEILRLTERSLSWQ